MSVTNWTEAEVAGGLATLDTVTAKLKATQIPTQLPTWSKYLVTFVPAGNWSVNGVAGAALAAAGTQSLALFTKAANTVIHKAIIKHSAAFAGPSISAFTAGLGVAGDVAGIVTAFDVLQAVGSTKFKEEAKFSEDLAAVGVVLSLTATGANISVLTAGALTVWVCSSVLP